MTDSQIMQDFFDTFEVTNKLNAIVHVENFLAARHALVDLGPNPDTSPTQILSCCKMILGGIGPRLFKSFITLENVAPGEGLDDVWAHWCPLPDGVELHRQPYPARTIPLWSNGEKTVFVRVTQDQHGNDISTLGPSSLLKHSVFAGLRFCCTPHAIYTSRTGAIPPLRASPAPYLPAEFDFGTV